MGWWILAFFLISIGAVVVLFVRADLGKGVAIESSKSQFFEKRFQKEIYGGLSDIMASLTGPTVKMVLRGEKSLGKDCIGVFIGDDDPSADQLAVPDEIGVQKNHKSFYGYRLYAAEVYLGSPEPHIQVTYERGKIDIANRHPLIRIELYSFDETPYLLEEAERWFRKLESLEKRQTLLKLETAP